MKMLASKLLVVLLIALTYSIPIPSFSQPAAPKPSSLTSEGREFFLGYFPSSNTCDDNTKAVYALVSSFYNADVKISYFDNTGQEMAGKSYKVTPTKSAIISLDPTKMTLNDPNGEGDGEFKSCRITSTSPVTVHYFSTGVNNGGAYLAIPTHALGKEYVAQTLFANADAGQAQDGSLCKKDSSASTIMVIAAYDNTQVEIHNTGLTKKGRTGICYGKNATDGDKSFTITLKRGEVYAIKSAIDTLNSLDGTYIKSSKPIAVLAGQENAFNGKPQTNTQIDYRDLMVEQMIPVEYWSDRDYFNMPLRDSGPRNNDDNYLGEQYRVHAVGEDMLTFNIDKQGPREGAVGPFCKFLQQSNVETGVNIRAQNGSKIGMEMYDYRQKNENAPYPAPSQMNIIPANSWKTRYSWVIPENKVGTTANYFCNIVTNKDSLTQGKILISVNGGGGRSANSFPSAGGYEIIPGHPELVGKRIIIGPGEYKLTGNTPCAVYIYGMLAKTEKNIPKAIWEFATPAGQAFSAKEGHKPRISAMQGCASEITYEVLAEDGIAYIELVNAENNLGMADIPIGYNFYTTTPPVIPTSVKYTGEIVIPNPLKPAKVVILAVSRSGQDSIMVMNIAPDPIALSKDSINFKPVAANKLYCDTITIRPLIFSARDRRIDSIRSENPHITITPLVTIPSSVKDSIRFQVCYDAVDTFSHHDSIWIYTNCFRAPLIVNSKTGIGLLKANDLDFGNVDIGDTACKMVTLRNIGDLPLKLTAASGPLGNFLKKNWPTLPITVPAGSNISLNICYAPTVFGDDSSAIQFTTDQPVQFTAGEDNIVKLKARGVFSAGVRQGASITHFSVIPNPSNQGTPLSINFQSGSASTISLECINEVGQVVYSSSMQSSKGMNRYQLPANSLPSGVYTIVLRQDNQRYSQKVTITK